MILRYLLGTGRMVSHDVDDISRQAERRVLRQRDLGVTRMYEAGTRLALVARHHVRYLIGRQRCRDVVVALTTHDAPANHLPLNTANSCHLLLRKLRKYH